MPSKRHGLGKIGLAVVAIVVVSILAVAFILPSAPHYGFVSENQVNADTGHNYTSSNTTSNQTNGYFLSGMKSDRGVAYGLGGSGLDFVFLVEADFNTSADASNVYVNLTTSLEPLAFYGAFTGSPNLHNLTAHGFTMTYVLLNLSIVLTHTLFLILGVDGSYIFMAYGTLSGNSSNVAGLAQGEAAAMTSFSL